MASTPDSLDRLFDYRLGMGQVSITVGGLIAAVVTLVLVWLLSRIINRVFQRHAAKREVRTRAAIYTLSRLANYALYVFGVLAALTFLGIPTTRFAVLVGALGVGLGFGLQAIFSNFISGIIMLFERSLRVGDVVELESGLHGEVRGINIRATLITTNDNIDILVPNSEFVTGRVVNWTHGDVSRHGEVSRRLHIPFGVAYGTDKELAKKAALEAAAEVPFTLALDGPRRPQVWLVKFGESSLEFELVVWLTADATKRPGAVKAAYMWALDTALCKFGIEIPNPQVDVHLRSLLDLRGDEVRAALPSPRAVPAIERGERRPAGAAEAKSVARDARSEAEADVDAAALPEHERAALASNDASEDVERGAREDEERREADERRVAEELDEVAEERASPAR